MAVAAIGAGSGFAYAAAVSVHRDASYPMSNLGPFGGQSVNAVLTIAGVFAGAAFFGFSGANGEHDERETQG